MNSVTKTFFLLFCLVLALQGKGYSQDLIVTQDNDSIQCKILQVSPSKIVYTQMDNETRTKNSYRINRVDVNSFKKDFYIPAEPQFSETDFKRNKPSTMGGELFFWGNFGLGSLSNNPYLFEGFEDRKDREMKNGRAFSFAVGCHVLPELAVVIEYGNFKSTTSFELIEINEDNSESIVKSNWDFRNTSMNLGLNYTIELAPEPVTYILYFKSGVDVIPVSPDPSPINEPDIVEPVI
ncbi:MAG: hypothetical protein ACPF8V_07525, partial [Luteibaculum sp.]